MSWLAFIFRRALTVVLVLISAPLQEGINPKFVVWNVGQGSWNTWVENRNCIHFDMGGEHISLSAIRMCRNIENQVYFSHQDTDHIGFAGNLSRKWNQFCVQKNSLRNFANPNRRQIGHIRVLHRLPACPESKELQKLYEPAASTSTRKFTRADRNSNSLSRVYLFREILLPGDSPSFIEKIWISQKQRLKDVRILILGHHGSNTSTSQELLNHLPRLKIAICSARQARYGHPHWKVVYRLKRMGIPVLRTDVWGHISLVL